MRWVLFALVVVAGCEASLGGTAQGGSRGDDPLRPDAGMASGDARPLLDALPMAAADNACGVASDHGDLGTLSAFAGAEAQGTTTSLTHWLEAPTPATASQATPDLVVIELWDGYGPFAGGVARAGTFTISGAETDYDTCGVCVLIAANVTATGASKLLFASAGTVTVTSVGSTAGQTTQATLSNATFVEISLDQATGTYSPVAGSNCPSPITRTELRGTI